MGDKFADRREDEDDMMEVDGMIERVEDLAVFA